MSKDDWQNSYEFINYWLPSAYNRGYLREGFPFFQIWRVWRKFGFSGLSMLAKTYTLGKRAKELDNE